MTRSTSQRVLFLAAAVAACGPCWACGAPASVAWSLPPRPDGAWAVPQVAVRARGCTRFRATSLRLIPRAHGGEGDKSSVREPQLEVVQRVLREPALRSTAGLMAASGALLGPNLDNFHSSFGVLTYANPIRLEVAERVLLTTDWWVPPLFAVAGLGMGVLYILFDELLRTPPMERSPTWPKVFTAISVFAFQYYASGWLTAAGVPRAPLTLALAALAAGGFTLLDATAAGLCVSLATAALGPAIEIFLVNALHLYRYNGADLWGVESWIPAVYFLGGPAVGALARALYNSALSRAGGEDGGGEGVGVGGRGVGKS